MRVGLKFGAPAKSRGAGPKWFCDGGRLTRWTVCTHAGHEMAMFASLGAVVHAEVVGGARGRGILQDVPDLFGMRRTGIGGPG